MAFGFGERFSDVKILKEKVVQYQKTNCVQLYVANLRKLAAKSVTKYLDPNLEY